MSTQPVPLTYEQMMSLFLETREQIEATNKAVASLSDRVGDMSEKLLIQSARAVEIIARPEGFVAKKW